MAKHSSTFTGSETAANLNSANAKTVTVKAKWKDDHTIPAAACTGTYGAQRNINLAVNGTQIFTHTSNIICAYLQKAGYYKLEVWGGAGARGSDNNDSASVGGYGSYSVGVISASSNTAIYVVDGGRGSQIPDQIARTNYGGGYNGGGGGFKGGNYSGGRRAGGGGGATHIATRSGVLSSLASYKSSVLIVAGGGGGGGCGCQSQVNSCMGGNGGGNIGGNGHGGCNGESYGGTQSSGGSAQAHAAKYTIATGSFGLGAYLTSATEGTSGVGGGGGGGWYGGGSAEVEAGGGGSGYIGNSLLLSAKGVTKQMYQYSGNAGGCTSSDNAATKTICTGNAGVHTEKYANTDDGYTRITYLGT